MRNFLIISLTLAFIASIGTVYSQEPPKPLTPEIYNGVVDGTVDSDLVIKSEIAFEPTVVAFWFGLNEDSAALTISGHESCFSLDRCRMTITFPDGSSKVIVWGIKDEPLKIEMRPLSDEGG